MMQFSLNLPTFFTKCPFSPFFIFALFQICIHDISRTVAPISLKFLHNILLCILRGLFYGIRSTFIKKKYKKISSSSGFFFSFSKKNEKKNNCDPNTIYIQLIPQNKTCGLIIYMLCKNFSEIGASVLEISCMQILLKSG